MLLSKHDRWLFHMNVKAFLLGSIVSTVVLLSGQLAYVLLASYMSLAALDVAFLKAHIQTLWYSMSLLTYGVCFAIGGFATAIIAEIELEMSRRKWATKAAEDINPNRSTALDAMANVRTKLFFLAASSARLVVSAFAVYCTS